MSATRRQTRAFAAAVCTAMLGATSMSDAKPTAEEIKDLQAQVTALNAMVTSQQQLLNSQVVLQAAQLSRDAVVDKTVLTNLQAQVAAQAALDKAKASAPFAELQGIKEGLTGLSVAGKEGTLAVAKGVDGSLLLRVKAELLRTLDDLARDIVKKLPDPSARYTIASDADLEGAYRAQVWSDRVQRQHKALGIALSEVDTPASATGGFEPSSVGAAVAAVQSVPFLLNVLSDAGKFFRTDRSVSLFAVEEEAQRILEDLLEMHAANSTPPVQVARAGMLSPDVVKQAEDLLSRTTALANLHDRALQRLGDLQRQSEAAAKLPAGQPKPALPPPEMVTRLREQATSARALLDALDPAKAPEAFWAQVMGQFKQQRLAQRMHIRLKVQGQIAQVLEKRVWRSDKLMASGGAQVELRITDPNGALRQADLLLVTSPIRPAFVDPGWQRWSASER